MIRFVLFSNLYIAAAAALLTAGSARLLGAQETSWALMVVVFGSTLLIYNLDRLVGADHEDRWERSRRHLWIAERRRWLWALAVVGALMALGGAPFLQMETLIVLGILGGISLGYAVPLGSSEKGRGWRLKQVPGVKTLLVALVWAVVTVILPATEQGMEVMNPLVMQEAVVRGVFIYALTLPFDVRDRRRDQRSGLKTMAVLLGDRRALGLSVVLVGLWTAAAGLRWALAGEVAQSAMVVTGGITLAALLGLLFWRSKGPVPAWYYVGILDGILLVYGLLLLLG